jgi:hypothetical protein
MMQPKKKWGWKTDVMKSKDDKKKLVATLDRWFSKFIRLRDSDQNGYCRCITCGRFASWKNMDAGHFISREKMATRYDEMNVHAQCQQCNRFKSGNQYEHGKSIDRMHGKGSADILSAKGGVRGCKLDSFYLQKLIEEYKEKVKNIHSTRC